MEIPLDIDFNQPDRPCHISSDTIVQLWLEQSKPNSRQVLKNLIEWGKTNNFLKIENYEYVYNDDMQKASKL